VNDIASAQADMRDGYLSGGAGILASALAWGAAAFAAFRFSSEQAVWVLFVGGIFIHPVGVIICRAMGARGNHQTGNPLGSLAIASTFWLIFSLPLAYVVALHRVEWFFPAMLLVIGGRYLVFASLFGMRHYWVLGLVQAALALLLLGVKALPVAGALAGALVELAFGLAVLAAHRTWVAGRAGAR